MALVLGDKLVLRNLRGLGLVLAILELAEVIVLGLIVEDRGLDMQLAVLVLLVWLCIERRLSTDLSFFSSFSFLTSHFQVISSKT